MEKHKVVILGAGIAGLSLSLYLYNMGIEDFIVLNPMNHDTHKACTGLLTEKCVNLLKELEIPLDGYEKVKHIKAFYNSQEVKDYSQSGLSLYHHIDCGRDYLDEALFKKCQSFKIKIIENCGNINILKDKRVLSLTDNSIAYDYLVDARGFYSDADICKHKDIGFELKIEHPLTTKEKMSKIILCDDLKGYGWIIYGEKYDVLGFVDEFNIHKVYKQIFDSFAEQYYEKSTSNYKYKGAFIPVKPMKLYINESYIQIGDKAGLVDPLTQEGIYYALASAKAAAFAIKNNNLKEYPKTMRMIVRNLKFAYKIRNLFFSKRVQAKIWNHVKEHQFSDYIFKRYSNDDYYFSYQSLNKYRKDYKNSK